METLGEVKLPSGRVLIVDTGLLELWRHDQPPTMPEGIMPPEATASVNGSQDFRIEGADAEQAGSLYGRQRHPRYLFDIPQHVLAEAKADFDAFVAQRGLDAKLVAEPTRVTHLRRAGLAIERGQGAGELQMHGVPVVAAGALPADRPLRVVGERCAAAEHQHLWQYVALELRPGAVASSAPAGVVGVDWARLMFVDLDALGLWRHRETTDGKADFVFWGRDAQAAAKRFDVPALADGQYGWLGLDVQQVISKGEPIEAAAERGELKLSTDFRPHTQQHALLAQMRTTPTESGTLALGESTCCAFATSWGDGLFPVYRDLDASGQLLRLRIELGTAEAKENLRQVNGG